jgi:hypothetical protein
VIIVVIFLLIGPFGRRPLSMYISRYLYEIMAVVLIVVGLVWAWSVFAKRTNPTLGRWQYLAAFGIVLLGGGGLIDSTFVILYLRHHPHDFYLMEHYEIGRARMMQDILEGRENPSPQKHRPHELRLELTPAPSYFGVCSMSFGVVHLFMDQHRLPYDLFRFCPAPTTILSWEKLWQNHVTFWLSLNTSLAPTYVFMWDYMRTTRDLYDFLKKAHPPGTLRMITRRGEGHKLKVFYLKMTAAELQKWQKKLVKVNGEFLARKTTKDAQPTPAPTPTPLPTPTPTPSTTAAQQIFPRFTASAGPRVIVPTDSPAMTK